MEPRELLERLVVIKAENEGLDTLFLASDGVVLYDGRPVHNEIQRDLEGCIELIEARMRAAV